MTHARKVDANQAEIVAALRGIGCTVVLTSSVGGGCPDLLVGGDGVTYLFEVKRPGQEKRKSETARRQAAFRATWQGGPVVVVRSVDEALEWFGFAPSERRALTRDGREGGRRGTMKPSPRTVIYPDILDRGFGCLPAPSGPLCECRHPRDNGGHTGYEGEGECAECGCTEFRAAARQLGPKARRARVKEA